MTFPTPHGDKLKALRENDKLPDSDKDGVEAAIQKYEEWISESKEIIKGGEELVQRLVKSLNCYKNWIDLDLIFDSQNDFLYRDKGQLKLDNTILEEFLPILVSGCFPDCEAFHELHLGPTNALAQVYFDSNLQNTKVGGGMTIRTKDHDFALARPLFIKSSHNRNFNDFREETTYLAYVATEIKANLDKTMFQEAGATALDLKIALPYSRYFLLCEWLDMKLVSSAPTAIEEVIVLRKAKRMRANLRQSFTTAEGRRQNRGDFKAHLESHPLCPNAFDRYLENLDQLLTGGIGNEQDVLERGWF